jgi:uncharacterized membrane protein
MKGKAAITVLRSRDDVQRLWQSSDYRPKYIEGLQANVTFKDAPGDRGTEIHVDIGSRATPSGPVGELIELLTGAVPLARVKDELRRFKQHVETGIIPRSDGAPEGERFERMLKQRPAQPLPQSEMAKAGMR